MPEKCLPKVKAKEDYTRANMLIKWRKKEVDVQTASVKKAKLAVELSRAEQDVAQVSKLIEQNMVSAQKYNLSDFKAKVDKKQKGYQKALSTETKEIAEAKKLKAGHEKISKQ